MNTENTNEIKFTIDDARRLWQGTISEETPPEMSIKPDSAGKVSDSYSNLVIRPKQVSVPSQEPDIIGSDFEILYQLGEGGMGVVYRAKQASIDREVAVKMLHAESSQNEGDRSKFLGEAMVTANLDHPNIVPIHDLGSTEDGLLFYAMKEVKGTCWEDVLKEKTQTENLEILLKVCDAVAFAHDKGIIHRDLKPENVMLGDYGEVLVVDWGLAACGAKTPIGLKAEQLTEASGRAGTPAYMSPEMAKCEFSKIGTASDIYLLGGILFEIITGTPPHTGGGNVFACIFQASQNIIEPTEKKGELVDIAMMAMATEPEKRYASVKKFQKALRDYQDHSESIRLTEIAQNDFMRAQQSLEYNDYAQALFGLKDALKTWEHNEIAHNQLGIVRTAYAECALDKGDLDLAKSLLDAKEDRELLNRVDKAIKAREARKRKMRIMTGVIITGTGIIVAVSVISAIWIGGLQKKTAKERDRAIAAEKAIQSERDKAVASEKKAKEAEKVAIAEKHKAEDALNKMLEAQKAELLAKQETEKVKKIAGQDKLQLDAKRKQEVYYRLIGEASKKISNLESSEARDLLLKTPPEFRDWEWGYLMASTKSGVEKILKDAGRPPYFILLTTDEKILITVSRMSKETCFWDISSGKKIRTIKNNYSFTNGVVSHDGKKLILYHQAKSPSPISLFDVDSGKLIAKFPKGVNKFIKSIDFLSSKNEVLIIETTRDTKTNLNHYTATILNLKTKESKILYEEQGQFLRMSLSSDAKKLAISKVELIPSSKEKRYRAGFQLLDIHSGKGIFTYSIPETENYYKLIPIVFSRSGRYMGIWYDKDSEYVCEVFDLTDKKKKYRAHFKGMGCRRNLYLSFTPDEKQLICIEKSSTNYIAASSRLMLNIQKWNFKTDKSATLISKANFKEIAGVKLEITEGCKWLLISDRKEVKVMNLQVDNSVPMEISKGNYMSQTSFISSSRVFLADYKNWDIWIYNLNNMKGGNGFKMDPYTSPSGKLIIEKNKSGKYSLKNRLTEKTVFEFENLPQLIHGISVPVHFSPDETRLTYTYNKRNYLVNLETKRQVEIKLPLRSQTKFHPLSGDLYFSEEDNLVNYDTKEKIKLPFKSSGLRYLFSPDGKDLLIIIGFRGKLKLIDISSGKTVWEKALNNRITGISFSKSGKRIVYTQPGPNHGNGGGDEPLGILDSSNGKSILKFPILNIPYARMAFFSADGGSLLIVGGVMSRISITSTLYADDWTKPVSEESK